LLFFQYREAFGGDPEESDRYERLTYDFLTDVMDQVNNELIDEHFSTLQVSAPNQLSNELYHAPEQELHLSIIRRPFINQLSLHHKSLFLMWAEWRPIIDPVFPLGLLEQYLFAVFQNFNQSKTYF
jgi:hypothetical protein